MGKIFCAKFQSVPLKFHTKYLTHTISTKNLAHFELVRNRVRFMKVVGYLDFD